MERGMRQTNRTVGIGRALVAAAGALVAAAAVLPAPALAAESSAVSVAELDRLIMRDGRVIEGRIISETFNKIQIMVVVAGIEAPSTFAKSDIEQVIRGTGDGGGDGGGDDAGAAGGIGGIGIGLPTPASSAPSEYDDETPDVYFMKLTGQMGRDIAAPPLRDMIDDARQYDPEYIVIWLDNDWSNELGDELSDDNAQSFDVYSVVEDLEPVLTTEVEQTFDDPPEVVFWIRNAMGGAAFLPFTSPNLYFHPDGRIGGIGTLDNLFDDGSGDEVVIQKQRSLRLARAQGIAIRGGYDYRFIDALSKRSYELSYDIVGGRPVLRADNAGRYILTDNGDRDNEDTVEQRVRNLGNDVLTLRPDVALTLGVSDGTAEELDDVLSDLGILRNHRLHEGRAEKIAEGWSDRLRRAERRLPEMREEFERFRSGNDRRSLGRAKAILEDFRAMHRRYGNALPIGQQVGIPPAQIDVLIEQLEVEIILTRN